MDFVVPSVTDLLSGILALSSDNEAPISIRRIHSIICEMKPHESIFKAIHFSITGDVCYSRKLDGAIKVLVDRGLLQMVDQSSVVVVRTPKIRTRFLSTLTYTQFHALQSASRRFYERLLEMDAGPRRKAAHG